MNFYDNACSDPCACLGLSVLTLSTAQKSVFHSRDVSVKKSQNATIITASDLSTWDVSVMPYFSKC